MRDEEVVGIGANDDAAEHLAETGVRLVVGDPLLARVLSQADVETAVRDRHDRRRRPGQPQHGARRGGAQRGPADRHPHVRPGARLAHPGALPRCRRPVVLGARGTRLRVRCDRRRDRHPLPARRPGPRVARIRGPAPLPDVDPDRSPACRPDRRAPARRPKQRSDLILVDIGEVAADGGAEGDGVPPRPAAPVIHPARGAVESIRSRFRAPEQRLLRFGAILVILAVGSAVFFDLVAGLTPLDAVSYAITLLTGASLPADIAGRRRQHRVARLRDLPEPRRGGHRRGRLRVHHGRAHPVAAPPDARSTDGPGRHPRPRHRRRAGLDRLPDGPRHRRARRAGGRRRGQRRRTVRLADAGRRHPGIHRRRPPRRGARRAPSRDGPGDRRGDQRRPGQPVRRAQRAKGTTGPPRRRPPVRPGVRDTRPARLPDPVHPQRVAPRGTCVRRSRGPIRGHRDRPRR